MDLNFEKPLQSVFLVQDRKDFVQANTERNGLGTRI